VRTKALTKEALRGLKGTIIGSKRCRRNYGTTFSMPFKHGVDPLDGNVWIDPIDGAYRSGWMEWQIRKVSGTYSLFDSHTDLFG
jgi:hypothetical protein